jgi:cell division protein FtsI/penicillin-binding protein 2
VRTKLAHPGRIHLFALLFSLAWAGLVWRLTVIQVVASHKYRQRAQEQHLREVTLPARRGEIVDVHGRLLAADRLLYTVGVHPRLVKDPPVVAALLDSLLGKGSRHWREQIRAHQGFFYAARRQELRTESPAAYELPAGVEMVREYRRTYPRRDIAAQLIGHVGVDGQGMEGLELYYEEQLRGREGRLIQQVDATGAPIPGLEATREDPVDGLRLHLTLDAVIQEVVQEELARGVTFAEAQRGTAVALDPRTGAVLAMASVPAYDLNAPQEYPAELRRNRVVTDPFEPGSVNKIVTFAAALDAGRFTPADTIDGGNGVIQVVGAEIRDTKAHGKMSLGEVLGQSSNVGTIMIAQRIGEARLYRTARDFGYGQPTGIDLPAEEGGVLRKIPEWYGPALESLSIGYGISVTTLQVATAFAALADGGELLRPYVVSAVEDGRGHLHRVGSRQVVRRVMHEETSAILRGFLKEAVTRGTGDLAAVYSLEIAGKTGTARKAGAGGYEAGAYNSSFCGFLPASAPTFLLFVVIDEPAHRYYAREVAAPVFARVVRRLASHPERPLDGLGPVIHQVAEHPDPLVPDLRRRPADEAARELTRRGLKVRLVGRGPLVLAQEPEPLSPARPGQVVLLRLEEPAVGETAATVPDLRGRTLREAAAEASALGLTLNAWGSGVVYAQDPPPGRRVSEGSTLSVRARRPGPGAGR